MTPTDPFSDGAPHLVLVHLGRRWYDHVLDCVAQAVRTSPNLEVWLVANARHRRRLPPEHRDRLRFVAVESLPRTPEHTRFIATNRLDSRFRHGFWRYATERFFVIDELLMQFGVRDCFHCENDNLVYAHLGALLPLMRSLYPGIAATFDNDRRCIPGFMFFGSREASRALATFLAAEAARPGTTDMEMLAGFFDRSPRELIDSLPIVPKNYAGPWRTPSGMVSERPSIFTRNADVLDYVFDAAALGQYLGGIDPRNTTQSDTEGFVNESCIFDPAMFAYRWEYDPPAGWLPYVVYGGVQSRIGNLHIHSKQLQRFRS